MRLSTLQREQINEVFQKTLDNTSAELRLYGSRTDDSRQGGDIDLLLILNYLLSNDEKFTLKLDLLVQLKKVLGDQKIDLTVISENEIHSDPFIRLVYPDSIILHRW